MRRKTLLMVSGGSVYGCLEIIWRGHTHISMIFAGGICLLLIDAVCRKHMKMRPTWQKCAIGSFIITIIEFATGIIVNRILKLNVWDYSSMPLNLLGQICLPYSLLWFFLTYPAIYFAQWIESACTHKLRSN